MNDQGSKRRGQQWLLNLAVALCAALATALVLEVGLRLYHVFAVAALTEGQDQESSVPAEVLCDCPFLYRLNPDHPEISSQGLRDDEVAIPRTDDALRILVLGDSVAYGPHVPPQRTFPNQLERILSERTGAPVEVVNTGVTGYTTFNELQYYKQEGRRFDADLVLLAFVLNDVVNPRLHWNYTREKVRNIPPEAIPNAEYDRGRILPLIANREYPAKKLGSELIGLVDRRLGRLFGKQEAAGTRVDGDGWPIYITGEDSISITVLTQADSPESRWLYKMLDDLVAEVAGDEAAFALVMVPLAYQLDPDYPYLPQRQLAEYCDTRALACLDVLPSFRRKTGTELFVGETQHYLDVWHLTDAGHEALAQEIAGFLLSSEWCHSAGRDDRLCAPGPPFR